MTSSSVEYQKWMQATSAESLIQEASSKKGYKLALKAIEAASPVLQKFGCGMITGVGDIPCFLQISVEVATGNAETSLVMLPEKEDGDPVHHLTCYGEDAKKLAAAFALDYENANFIYMNDQNEAKRLMILTPSTINRDKMDTSIMCLSNLRYLISKDITSFHVGCAK